MAKKKRTKSTGELRESVHRIWLAGLGALATAESEGGKLFSTLVDRGEEFAGRGKPPLSRLRTEADRARARAGQTWERVEDSVDKTVSSALKRLGIPTKSDISSLTRKVERLTKKLDELQPGSSRRAKKPRKKSSARRAAGATVKKKTTRRKTSKRRVSRAKS